MLPAARDGAPILHAQRVCITLAWLAMALLSAQARAAGQCQACHTEPVALGPYHAPDAIGCVACHGGNPASAAKNQAHAGMEAYPGRMATAATSCGQAACHADLIPKVAHSIMQTGDGMIALTRSALREPPGHLTEAPAMGTLAEHGVDGYLRKLCVSCHLGTERTHHTRSMADRGGGCAACHVEVDPAGLRGPNGLPTHPALTARVSDARCFGCHSRSSRIALNYVGLAEIDPPPTGPAPQRLEDGRAVELQSADVHSLAGMACIDCHTAAEVMGDGSAPRLQREAKDIACRDCHGPGVTEKDAADLSRQEIVAPLLQGWRTPDLAQAKVLATSRKGSALMHLGRVDGQVVLHTKVSGKLLPVPAVQPGPAHTLKGHERLTCESCHATWAPQCFGCHVGFDSKSRQWDHLAAKTTPGAWVETRWHIVNGPPALGVDADGSIAPFVPGMNLVADLPGRKTLRSVRYARISPHTTQRAGRPCVSCHGSDAAVGLITGRSHAPGHPEWSTPTGWTTASAAPAPGLRPGERSFNREELGRIRRVGTCLPCHSGEQPLYQDFSAALATARTRSGHPPPPALK